MKTKRAGLGVALVVTIGLVAGCGGDGGGRPSADDLSQAIQDEAGTDQVTSEQADCVAGVFVDSDISDEGLQKIVDNADVDEIADVPGISDDDVEASDALDDELGGCFGLEADG